MKLLLALLLLLLVMLFIRWVTGMPIRRQIAGFQPLICRYRPHVRGTRTVTKIGDRYFGRCRRCGADLEKSDRDSPWVESPRQMNMAS